MKFLVALGSLASAMALATPPVRGFNKRNDVSVYDPQRGLQDVSIMTTRYVKHVKRPDLEPHLAYMILFSSLIDKSQKPSPSTNA